MQAHPSLVGYSFPLFTFNLYSLVRCHPPGGLPLPLLVYPFQIGTAYKVPHSSVYYVFQGTVLGLPAYLPTSLLDDALSEGIAFVSLRDIAFISDSNA